MAAKSKQQSKPPVVDEKLFTFQMPHLAVIGRDKNGEIVVFKARNVPITLKLHERTKHAQKLCKTRDLTYLSNYRCACITMLSPSGYDDV